VTDAAHTPPSGEQHEIAHGRHRAVVVEVGGGLRSYAVDGHDVLDGYTVDAMADGARGQTLVPWPNRIRDGAWQWKGETKQLALTEPAQHNAIHGLVRWSSWRVVAEGAGHVSLACTSWPQLGYPWPIRVRNDYALDDAGLVVTTTVTNIGAEPAPLAVGFHPYLTVGTDTIDTATLHLPVEQWLPTGDQQIPMGSRRDVEGSAYDFRTPRLIGGTEIDLTFTGLRRDDDGRFRLGLSGPTGRAVTFWLGPAYDYVEIFTGDALPDPARRRRGLGVEPMTAPPDAFNSGESLVVLGPAEQWTGQWGIEA
jgi:aldose 1-epimerase